MPAAAVAALVVLSPAWLATAATLLIATVVVAVARRVRLGRVASACVLTGAACWAAAAGSPCFDRPAARSVAVLVDLSPSTRGAAYRDRAWLDRRVAQLLGDTPAVQLAFAGGQPVPLPAGPTLADLPCDTTVFAPPPDADAVLLFSDGRFNPPPFTLRVFAPPVFAVVDPKLTDVSDSAVRGLRWAGDRVSATVAADGEHALAWTGADPPTATVAGGTVVVTVTPSGDDVAAAVAGTDRWPENDRLSVHAPPPPTAERWWVGSSPPPGYRAIAALPTNPAAYLSAAAIVLDDVPADALTSAQQRRLGEFVRDLGGGLVIGGGPRAFAAGGYGGTALDGLSPLASDPPRSAERWVVLIDGSGSMATGDGPSPWRAECDAVARLVPVLPGADPVRIGSFADRVRWWSADDAPAATVAVAPPAEVRPGGVTNLAAALRAAIAGADPAVPSHLVLMTDADADLPDADALIADAVRRRVRLHLLATGNGAAAAALRRMVAATGGSAVEQSNPAQWAAAARALTRGAVPVRWVDSPTAVRWHNESGPDTVAAWNRTWAKPTADVLADGESAPIAAVWSLGVGRVASVAYAADAGLLDRLAGRVAAPPRDPRFDVAWSAGPQLRVTVRAADASRFLNGLAVTLDVDDGRPRVTVPQTAPGAYAVAVPEPRRPAVATVRVGGTVVERFAVAGRYAAEFEAVGVDRTALAALADLTGGTMVEPSSTGPLRFPGPVRRTPLAPPLAVGGAVAISAGLVWWRRRSRG